MARSYRHSSDQVPTVRISISEIMHQPQFALGVSDARAGRAYRDAYQTWHVSAQWGYARPPSSLREPLVRGADQPDDDGGGRDRWMVRRPVRPWGAPLPDAQGGLEGVIAGQAVS
jgi:hypothetical protein